MLFQDKKLILGSQSPRRKELLTKMDLQFEVRVSNVEEIIPESMPVEDVAEYLAKLKSDAIEIDTDEMLITADSIVVLNQAILGKPKDNAEAKSFLLSLSDRQHDVFTGVAIRDHSHSYSFTEKTAVWIAEINENEIDYYLEHYDALDKAGAYGIQDWIGWVKVEKMVGAFSNVMGLPTHRVYQVLKDWPSI